MKIKIFAEPNEQNIMEFDCTGSDLTQEELVRNVHAVASEWIRRYDDDNSNLDSTKA